MATAETNPKHMTTLGRSVILFGVFILTTSMLLWILTGDWHWAAGGASIFFGTLLGGALLSVETKTPTNNNPTPTNKTKETDTETDNDPFSS